MTVLVKKIALVCGKQTHLIAINDIVLVKAANIYSHVYLDNGQEFVTSETISSLEKQLATSYFYRTHRSYLVNLYFINTYQKAGLKLFLKNNNYIVPIARDKKKDFERVLNSLFLVL